MTREKEIKKIALCYAHDELKDNHGGVEDIVASAFIDGVDYADAHPHWRLLPSIEEIKGNQGKTSPNQEGGEE